MEKSIYRAWHTVEHASVGKDLIPVTINNIGREWNGKDLFERIARKVFIARVHARNVLAVGMGDSFIYRIVYTIICL